MAIAALDEAGGVSVGAAMRAPAATAVRVTPSLHPHIPSLDGLRFLAALSVMIAHGYWFIVLLEQLPPVPSFFAQMLLSGANIGMTLFFVLSGFVIHLNYHKTVPAAASGKVDFFIARFARLYPLFLLVFGFDFFRLLWAQGYFSGYVFTLYNPFRALPYFLTFTQTWWWWPIGDTTAAGYYATRNTGATGVMWSLSTEAFFYVAYLFCAGALARLSGRALAGVAIVATAYGLAFYLLGWSNGGVLVAWAHVHYPNAPADDFLHWLLFQSPWGRISEFLLGAVAAQALMAGHAGGPGFISGRLLTYGALTGVALMIIATCGPIRSLSGIGTQSVASLVAILIYATARYRSYLSGLFASRPFVILGNASYSLYLLHYFFLHDYGQRLVVGFPQLSRWAIFAAMMLVSFAAACVSYQLIERPAIRWIRGNFRALRFGVWLPATLALIAVFSVAATLQMRALARSAPNEQPGHIAVSSASFGDNCNAKLHDNLLGLMRRVCGGERSCRFEYDVLKLGDPAAGCGKRFQALYSCNPNAPEREFSIPLVDHPQVTIALSCK
jgi:peptidoglycan/LPS O-acetylase OafA/YrhL